MPFFRRYTLAMLERIAPVIPVPDKVYLHIKYYCRMGKRLNLKNPQTFNEKLQWLKLYGRRPIDTVLSDKYAVKEYIAKTIGEQYVIPLLGVWDRFEDIDFDKLPDQFVLKCTHDSGGIIICKDKSKLDRELARKKLNKSLKTDYFVYSREHAYKNIPRRIIAEKYMEDSANLELQDYKVHNFDGKPKMVLLCQSRFSEGGLREDFYTPEWEHMPVSRPGHPNADAKATKPAELDEILSLSEKLAKEMPFVRTDFYIINGKTYFGEITYSPAGGMTPFIPDEWDKILGNWIPVPNGGGNLFTRGDVVLYLRMERERELKDYKFFCFDGEVKFFKIDFGRFTEHHANYYDTNGNLLPFGESSYPPLPKAEVRIPQNLSEMVQLASQLSKGCPFVRVDFYDANGRVYFGEFTFSPAGGMGHFDPEEWDSTFGSWLQLSKHVQ